MEIWGLLRNCLLFINAVRGMVGRFVHTSRRTPSTSSTDPADFRDNNMNGLRIRQFNPFTPELKKYILLTF